MGTDGYRRRDFLYRVSAVAAVGALAGCAGGNGSSGSGSDSTPTGTGGATTGTGDTTDGATAMVTETDAPATSMGTTTGATTGTGPSTESATTTGATTESDTRPVVEPAPPAVDRFLEPASFYDGNMVVGVSLVGVGGSGRQIGFDPAAIKVATGTTVTWEWISGRERHSVTSTDSENERVSFNSGPRVGTGTTFQHTFERPGIYRYLCGVHRTEGARGVVVVAPGSDVGGSGSG